MCLVYFYEWNGDHRDLNVLTHSFPTRRSSDLWKNAAIALIAALCWGASGLAPWPDMAIQIGLAVSVFAVFALVFAMGWMGGGDVKLIGALALWFPFQPLLWVLIVMSLAGEIGREHV